jgi:hypothetical protein
MRPRNNGLYIDLSRDAAQRLRAAIAATLRG